MMVVQAETARVGTPGLGAEGSKSLEVIRDTGRQALSEMRRVVGVLRRDPDLREPEAPAERAPQPSLERVDELVAAARAAGTHVTLHQELRPPALPAMVELCGYRIIQEALTNVRRHAPGATAEVVVRFSDGALHIRVTDDGPGADPVVRQGHGLVGMRERAAMVGGRLWVGPLSTGGFLVEAELPTYGTPVTHPSQPQPQPRPQRQPPDTEDMSP